MRIYRFGLTNGNRVIEIVASSLKEAKRMFREQLQAEGLV
jgi:hypothetical protein